MMAAISGPAVHDVETVFRERWLDPTPLTRNVVLFAKDKLLGMDMDPDPLPEQAPPPPPVEGGTHAVQLLRTYPNLRHGRDYPFARGGERSVARGYTKALTKARRLIYVEDQYLWGLHVGDVFTQALRDNPELRVIAVRALLPRPRGGRRPHPAPARPPPRDARDDGRRARPGRASTASRTTPARRSTCTPSAASSTTPGPPSAPTTSTAAPGPTTPSSPRSSSTPRGSTPTGCASPSPPSTSAAVATPAAVGRLRRPRRDVRRLRADGRRASTTGTPPGSVGPRPPGRLRRLQPPDLPRLKRALALPLYLRLHDPDGRPGPLRKKDEF